MTMNNMNALFLTDFYKVSHFNMYPKGTSKIYSNLTPRKSRLNGVNEVVVFGIQYMLKKMKQDWDEYFFNKSWDEVETSYKELILNSLGVEPETSHLKQLHEVGYLPLEIKALDEGTKCPIKVPLFTVTNTVDHAYWLVNYLETYMSSVVWKPITSATIAHTYRKILDEWANETGDKSFVDWQGHDFSMRGMSCIETAMASGAGHLLSFRGTDTIPAIPFLQHYYGAKGFIGASVPATEHSVACMGTKDGELNTFRHLMATYPKGILSIVSDTWDLWKVCTEYLPILKEEILTRDGKIVIRPDSGHPSDILCGMRPSDVIDMDWEYKNYVIDEEYETEKEQMNVMKSIIKDRIYDQISEAEAEDGSRGDTSYSSVFTFGGKFYNVEAKIKWRWMPHQSFYSHNVKIITFEETKLSPEQKGVVELLWDVFGGTINEKGYKVLDPHIGAIYGDSITLEIADDICYRLEEKGFASTNVVLGIGLA